MNTLPDPRPTSLTPEAEAALCARITAVEAERDAYRSALLSAAEMGGALAQEVRRLLKGEPQP